MAVGNLALILTQSDSPNTHGQPHRYTYKYVHTYVQTYMPTYMAILAAIDVGSSQGTMNHQAFSWIKITVQTCDIKGIFCPIEPIKILVPKFLPTGYSKQI